MDVFMKAYTPRVVMGLVFAAVVWWTSRVGSDGHFPFYYYIIIILLFILHQVHLYMCVCVCILCVCIVCV